MEPITQWTKCFLILTTTFLNENNALYHTGVILPTKLSNGESETQVEHRSETDEFSNLRYRPWFHKHFHVPYGANRPTNSHFVQIVTVGDGNVIEAADQLYGSPYQAGQKIVSIKPGSTVKPIGHQSTKKTTVFDGAESELTSEAITQTESMSEVYIDEDSTTAAEMTTEVMKTTETPPTGDFSGEATSGTGAELDGLFGALSVTNESPVSTDFAIDESSLDTTEETLMETTFEEPISSITTHQSESDITTELPNENITYMFVGYGSLGMFGQATLLGNMTLDRELDYYPTDPDSPEKFYFNSSDVEMSGHFYLELSSGNFSVDFPQKIHGFPINLTGYFGEENQTVVFQGITLPDNTTYGQGVINTVNMTLYFEDMGLMHIYGSYIANMSTVAELVCTFGPGPNQPGMNPNIKCSSEKDDFATGVPTEEVTLSTPEAVEEVKKSTETKTTAMGGNIANIPTNTSTTVASKD